MSLSTLTKSTANTGSKFKERHERAQADRASKNRQVVTNRFPDIHDITEPVYWGVFSWTLAKSHIRLIRKATSVNIGAGFCTPGDVVRDYLDCFYPKRLRAYGGQARAILSPKSTPLFGRYGVFADGAYVDITSAYHSISNICGWNVDYYPSRFLIPGRSTSDFPLPNNKTARSCLVSMGISKHANFWTGQKFKTLSIRNAHLNFGLWTLVQDILHSIAAYAFSLGALYVHTDGYILPYSQAARLQSYISEWGLSSTVKARGETMVLGIGNFKVDTRQTKRFRPLIQPDIRYIREVNTGWLLKNWRSILTRVDG